MLLGQYEGKVGEKNRTATSQEIKGGYRGELIITLGYENSLIIVSESGWKALLEEQKGGLLLKSPQERLSVTFSEEQHSLNSILREGCYT